MYNSIENVIPLLKRKGFQIDDPWDIVDAFEILVADYAGSKFAVSCDSCTNAMFMCLIIWQPVPLWMQNIEFGYQIVDLVAQIHDLGDQIQDVVAHILDLGAQVLDSGAQIQDLATQT